jgi:hypothetical protein
MCPYFGTLPGIPPTAVTRRWLMASPKSPNPLMLQVLGLFPLSSPIATEEAGQD